jgi:hypothetical protein
MQVPAVAEHASPSPAHSSLTQQPPSLQACPGQQFSPGPPHDTQRSGPVRGSHTVPGAVQSWPPVLLAQHGSPSPPHENVEVPQLPSVQVVVVPHIVPAPEHVPRMQHPPAAQVVSPQQG